MYWPISDEFSKYAYFLGLYCAWPLAHPKRILSNYFLRRKVEKNEAMSAFFKCMKNFPLLHFYGQNTSEKYRRTRSELFQEKCINQVDLNRILNFKHVKQTRKQFKWLALSDALRDEFVFSYILRLYPVNVRKSCEYFLAQRFVLTAKV